MFPDKSSLIRSAKVFFVILAVAPALYILIAAVVANGGRVLARDPKIIPILFLGMVAVSIADIGFTILFQTSSRITSKLGYNPVSRAFQIFSLGAVLSEAHSVFGLVVTLLSGSVLYVIGFSIVAWTSLFWVRSRFKHNLGQLPDQ